MELYAIGDSFVFGSGVPAGRRWTALCERDSGWTVHNLGVSGDTLPGILTRVNVVLPALVQANGSPAAETCVLVAGGTNDIFCGSPAALLRPTAAAILQQLAAKGLCPIACVAPLPTGDALPESWRLFADPVACIPQLNDYGDWLGRYCAAFGFPFLDLRPLFLLPDGTPRRELSLDGIHPNADGHVLIAAALTALLRKLAAS